MDFALVSRSFKVTVKVWDSGSLAATRNAAAEIIETGDGVENGLADDGGESESSGKSGN